jgi:hypothetical protein
MKVRPNDLEISAGLAREFCRKATEAGTDPTSVCMGMLGVALAQLIEIDGREETREAFRRTVEALGQWTPPNLRTLN